MKTLFCSLLLLALLLFAGCSQVETEQPSPASSPVAPVAATSPSEASRPNRVIVSLGRTSPKIGAFKPRLIESYSPTSIELWRDPSRSRDFSPSQNYELKSPPAGMKWLVVIFEIDGTQEKVNFPANRIRIVDQSNKTYRLTGFGSSVDDTFIGMPDKAKIESFTTSSPTASKLKMLFAVASKAEGFRLEL